MCRNICYCPRSFNLKRVLHICKCFINIPICHNLCNLKIVMTRICNGFLKSFTSCNTIWICKRSNCQENCMFFTIIHGEKVFCQLLRITIRVIHCRECNAFMFNLSVIVDDWNALGKRIVIRTKNRILVNCTTNNNVYTLIYQRFKLRCLCCCV